LVVVAKKTPSNFYGKKRLNVRLFIFATRLWQK